MARRGVQRVVIEDVVARRKGDPRVDPSLVPPREAETAAEEASPPSDVPEVRESGLHPAAGDLAAIQEELRVAVHARVDLEIRLERARRLATDLRSVFEGLERLEIELAEVRSDALRVARELASELGTGDLERTPIVVDAESERPTSIPEPLDVSELMRAVEHL